MERWFCTTSPTVVPSDWRSCRCDEGQWTILAKTRPERRRHGAVRQSRVRPAAAAIPVAGDFNGDGVDEIGIYYQGRWYLDLNGNGRWDEDDLWARLGDEYDLPVTGDWNGDGKDDIGIFGPAWAGRSAGLAGRTRPAGSANNRTLPVTSPRTCRPSPKRPPTACGCCNARSQGQVQADVIDHVFRYGSTASISRSPGDWKGDGIKNIGVFHDGMWHLDTDGDGRLNEGDRDSPVRPDRRPARGGRLQRRRRRRDRRLSQRHAGSSTSTTTTNWTPTTASSSWATPAICPVVGDLDGDGLDDPAVYHDGPAEYTARGPE